MPSPLGFHLVLSTYGFWLPNDPRGSWSRYVGLRELYHHSGPATTTDQRRSLASRLHDQQQRRTAKRLLAKPPVRFDGIQARAVGRGFRERLRQDGLTVFACAILPDHVHLALNRTAVPVSRIAARLKAAATHRLLVEERHPFRNLVRNGRFPKIWARGEWKVFLWTEAEMRRVIRYVEENPIRQGKPPQRWSFATPYDR